MRILLLALLCSPLAAAAAPEEGGIRMRQGFFNEPDSRSPGVNTGELLAYCYRDGYEFRESLEALAIVGGDR